MNCPFCQRADSRVLDTRGVGEGIRRRRECLICKQRFTTYERIARTNLMVIKADGRREEFD
ncbi:MAG: transcriptional regulator NrdR, partial [Ardenticatenaceae bacterium]